MIPDAVGTPRHGSSSNGLTTVLATTLTAGLTIALSGALVTMLAIVLSGALA